MSRVVVSEDLCFGSGTCQSTFPQAFELDDDDVLVVLPGEKSLDDADRAGVVSSCPAGALRLVES